MMRGGIRVEGLNKTIRGMQKLGIEVDDLKATFAGIAAEGAQIAAQLAPARTGRLSGTIRGNRSKNRATVTAGKARIPYAGLINYGWPDRSIQPNLFMQRADTQLQPRVVAMLEAGLDDATRKAGLR